MPRQNSGNKNNSGSRSRTPAGGGAAASSAPTSLRGATATPPPFHLDTALSSRQPTSGPGSLVPQQQHQHQHHLAAPGSPGASPSLDNTFMQPGESFYFGGTATAAPGGLNFWEHFRGDNRRGLAMSIVVAILIVSLIFRLSQWGWALVEPYANGIIGAVILSIAMHDSRFDKAVDNSSKNNENNNKRGETDEMIQRQASSQFFENQQLPVPTQSFRNPLRSLTLGGFDPQTRHVPVSKRIADRRALLHAMYPAADYPWLSCCIPLCAVPIVFQSVLNRAAESLGVDKYSVLADRPAMQQLATFAVLLLGTARLSRVIVRDLGMALIFAFVLLVVVPLILMLVHVLWSADDRTLVRRVRLLFIVVFGSIIMLGIPISITLELRESGQETVSALQRHVHFIPDNFVDIVVGQMFSKNTTEMLLPMIHSVQYNGTLDDLWGENQTWSGSLASLRGFVSRHVDVLSAARSELQHIVDKATDSLFGLARFAYRGFWFVYEFFLFVTTTSMLLAMEHSVLFYGINKAVRIVRGASTPAEELEAQEIAHAEECKIINSLARLFSSLFHLFSFHFLITLIWFTVLDIPLTVSFATLGGLIALFQTLPPVLTQALVGLAVVALRSEMSATLLIISVAVYVAITVAIYMWVNAESASLFAGVTQRDDSKPSSRRPARGSRNKNNNNNNLNNNDISTKRSKNKSDNGSANNTTTRSRQTSNTSPTTSSSANTLEADSPYGSSAQMTLPPSGGDDDNINNISGAAERLAPTAATVAAEAGMMQREAAEQQQQQQEERKAREGEEMMEQWMLNTSLILGLTVHSLQGVITGPIVLILIKAVWSAL